MNISNSLFNQNSISHSKIDFVNTTVSRDTRLFIDPVLIEIGQSDFCKRAKVITADFFNQLYNAYYTTNDEAKKKHLLSHAQEINDSHLGYAHKYGHGNTEDGLFDIFKGIDDYISKIEITRLFELALYIPNFAEDGMSDLLTNVLYKVLSDFTVEQCKKFNVQTTKCTKERYYWNNTNHYWEKYIGESLIIDNEIVLLIPKEIIQTHYRFTCDNFLRSVIVENLCEQQASYDNKGKKSRPPKDKVREKIIKENGTVATTAIFFAQQDSNLLKQYQRIINEKYKTLQLSDDELDYRLYGNN